MSDQNNNSNPSTPTEPPPKAVEVLDKIKEVIAGSGAEVMDRVVRQGAEEVITERVGLVRKALAKYNEQRSALKKLNRPDVEQFDAEGKAIAFMSKAKFEEVKKAKEQLAKTEKALELAIGSNDFSKLAEVCK